MASYFHVTLDTTAPSDVALTINNGALYASSTAVNLNITLADEQTEGYQMKIWGVAGAQEETQAKWENFVPSKGVNLTDGDGMKTVFLKMRDDVGNESLTVSAQITLNTSVPVVTVTGPDRSKISTEDEFDQSVFHFSADVPFEAYKVCVVPTVSAQQEEGTPIPTEGGSQNTSGEAGGYPASANMEVTITGADLERVSPGDGVKVIKVFVRNTSGIWSVV